MSIWRVERGGESFLVTETGLEPEHGDLIDEGREIQEYMHWRDLGSVQVMDRNRAVAEWFALRLAGHAEVVSRIGTSEMAGAI